MIFFQKYINRFNIRVLFKFCFKMENSKVKNEYLVDSYKF